MNYSEDIVSGDDPRKRIERLTNALREALLQLQYVQEAGPSRGTTATIITKIEMALRRDGRG